MKPTGYLNNMMSKVYFFKKALFGHQSPVHMNLYAHMITIFTREYYIHICKFTHMC